ncbi:hypothetical protein [Bacillus sp. T33-2]|uniref:hypothetical protein n=1 Tax=Bacillus sp. T33-2 TaxID=2054168 RepID=UPI000C76C8B6|nr:hypothetical protein [Bacillus sp. T33-2]PLR95104.1 hypothetical protein CVD19_15735 [Bacillus sp. T33-2]
MGKFDLVNQDLSALNPTPERKETIKIRNTPTKRRSWNRYLLAAFFLLVTGIFAAVLIAVTEGENERPQLSEKITNPETATEAEESTATAEPPLRTPGLEAGFKPEEMKTGSNAEYKLQLKMTGDNQFEADASIQIKNTSDKNWMQIMFFFHPNQMLKMSQEKCYRKVLSWAVDECLKNTRGGEINLQEVKVNGNPVQYELTGQSLILTLQNAIQTGQSATADIHYTFSIPYLLRENGNYNLLQWHPMLPNFQNEWIFNPYIKEKDSYTVDHSPIELSYDLSKNLQLVSSSDSDPPGAKSKGSVSGTQLKEMFIMLLDGHAMKETKVNDIQLRAFAMPQHHEKIDGMIQTASEALAFFENNIGKYPYKQLDLVITDSQTGNYPGVIVLPGSNKPVENQYISVEESLEHALVHEIAQQWFYGPVNIDRHTDAWLNDGLSELSTSLFFLSEKQKSEQESFAFASEYYEFIEPRENAFKSNLPIENYLGSLGGIVGHVQAKPAILLWEAIKPCGADMVALQFLSDYYQTYSYKKVTTQEFMRFTKSYFNIDYAKFTDWLFFDPHSVSELDDSIKL